VPRSFVTALAALSVALAWGGTWIVGKLAVSAVPPLELSAIRFVVASLALAVIARLTGTGVHLRELRPIALSAFFGYGLYNALVFFALTLAPASDGALIVPTITPVATAILAAFFGDRLTARKLSGFALASIGATLVITAGAASAAFSGGRVVGDLLMLAGAVSWSAYTMLGTLTLRRRSPLEVITIATPIGALLLLPLGVFEKGYADVPSWSVGVWLGVVYLALVVNALSFTVFYWVVRRVGPSLAAMSAYFVPLITLALAVVILGERPAPLQLVGGLVIAAVRPG
jgi:drug/metabolite transporter (DMT)-like permease